MELVRLSDLLDIFLDQLPTSGVSRAAEFTAPGRYSDALAGFKSIHTSVIYLLGALAQ